MHRDFNTQEETKRRSIQDGLKKWIYVLGCVGCDDSGDGHDSAHSAS